MDEIIEELPGVTEINDDIVVPDKNEEHDRNL